MTIDVSESVRPHVFSQLLRDGRQAIIAYCEGVIYTWDLASGRELSAVDYRNVEHIGNAMPEGMLPDGRMVITLGWNDTATGAFLLNHLLFDTQVQSKLAVLPVCAQPMFACCRGNEGADVRVGGWYVVLVPWLDQAEKGICVHDMLAGTTVHADVYPLDTFGFVGPYVLARRAYDIFDSRFSLINPATGKLVATLPLEQYTAIYGSAQGQCMVLVTGTNAIKGATIKILQEPVLDAFDGYMASPR